MIRLFVQGNVECRVVVDSALYRTLTSLSAGTSGLSIFPDFIFLTSVGSKKIRWSLNNFSSSHLLFANIDGNEISLMLPMQKRYIVKMEMYS